MEASTPRNFSCLGNRRLASGAVETLAKGGGQLALEDASSNGIRYLGGGLHCLIRGGRGSFSFETASAEFDVIVDEDATRSSLGRTKNIDVRHDQVRDACDTEKRLEWCVSGRGLVR